MIKRKICVITGSRAEYGLLQPLLNEIKNDSKLELQIIVTGMHLSTEFGLYYKKIEEDGFKIDEKVEMLLSSDTSVAICKSIGLCTISLSESLNRLNPDVIVILGDRFELLSIITTALVIGIPVAHIHGGEISEGAIDNSIRHAVTKMSHIHFASTEVHKKRIIQMGEEEKNVYNFGAPGLDNIYKLKLLSKQKLFNTLGLDVSVPTGIFTYHPATIEGKLSAGKQIQIVLEAIKASNINVVFTQSNSDKNGRIINEKIIEFCKENSEKYKYINNLGQVRYFSCLKNFDLVIGNSSSGIIEAPSFKIPTVNIGGRQAGRVKGNTVLDVELNKNEIIKAIDKAISKEFKNSLKAAVNPYSKFNDGKASYRIKEVLKNIEINEMLLKKKFNDIE